MADRRFPDLPKDHPENNVRKIFGKHSVSEADPDRDPDTLSIDPDKPGVEHFYLSGDARWPTVTEEAVKAIRGDRQKNYGHPRDNFKQIAEGWQAYLDGRGELSDGTPEPLRAHDVAVMMTIVKAMRLSGGYHRDSVIDIVGYAALDAIVCEDDEL